MVLRSSCRSEKGGQLVAAPNVEESVQLNALTIVLGDLLGGQRDVGGGGFWGAAPVREAVMIAFGVDALVEAPIFQGLAHDELVGGIVDADHLVLQTVGLDDGLNLIHVEVPCRHEKAHIP